jgi:hypothetical protein
LQANIARDDILDPAVRSWLNTTKNEPDEIERLRSLATDVIRAFKRDEFKDAKSVTEVVFLAPVLEKDDFRYLIKEFYSGIDQSGLLDVHQLEGFAHLIQGAGPDALDSDDLVKVLTLLSTRLRGTHQQSTLHLYQLTVAVSHVLDAMADASVKGLNRETIHEPLLAYLDGLKQSSDPYLVYQAAYAYQALMCVPDDESLWQATLRRGGKVTQGVSGLVSAVKGLDLAGFIEGLGKIQKGLAGASEIVQVVIRRSGITWREWSRVPRVSSGRTQLQSKGCMVHSTPRSRCIDSKWIVCRVQAACVRGTMPTRSSVPVGSMPATRSDSSQIRMGWRDSTKCDRVARRYVSG